LIGVEACEEIAESLNEATLVFFLRDRLNLAVNSLAGLVDENPEILVFRIGRATNSEILESVLSGNLLEANAIGIGKRIAGALRKITVAGTWVVNLETGERTRSRNHRYTVGAKESAEKGIHLKPIAGWNVVEIDTDE
jgi:hypothetical protein